MIGRLRKQFPTQPIPTFSRPKVPIVQSRESEVKFILFLISLALVISSRSGQMSAVSFPEKASGRLEKCSGCELWAGMGGISVA